MECITCKEKMVCYDDVNAVHTRIDWLECPKCDSQAEVTYSVANGYITKVVWTR